MKKFTQSEMNKIRSTYEDGIPPNHWYAYQCENHYTFEDTEYRIVTIFNWNDIMCEDFNYRLDVMNLDTKNQFRIDIDKTAFSDEKKYFFALNFL